MPDPAGLREIEAKDLVLGTVHLGFLHSFALPIPDGLRKEDLAATLRWGGFAARWDDPLAREFQVAEDFLLPPGQSRADFRQELDSLDLVIHTTNPAHDREITVRPVLTVYPTLDLGTLTLFAHLRGCTADDIVFLLQSMNGSHEVETRLPALFGSTAGHVRNPAELYVRRIRKCFDPRAREHTLSEPRLLSAHIVEVRLHESDGIAGAAELIRSHPRELYGLLSIDEGWRCVPQDLARDRLAGAWSTREHVRVISFGQAVLLVDCQYDPGNDYVRSQHRVRERYGVPCEEYFDLVPSVAGVNHGPLLMLEACATRASYLLQILKTIRTTKPSSIKSMIELRRDLNERLARLDLFGIREIGLLEEKLLASLSVDKARDEVARALEQLESELTIRYTQRVNSLLIWLTVLGVVSTALGATAAILAILPKG